MNFVQHVNEPTHVNGHTLDLVMSASYEHLGVNIVNIDRSVTSDHWATLFRASCSKPPCVKKSLTVRKWKNIDPPHLDNALNDLLLLGDSPGVSADPFSDYSECLISLSDRLSPKIDIVVTERTGTPWYNAELRHMKTECRKLERKWKSTHLTIDKEIFEEHRRHYSRLRASTKADYFKTKLQDARSPKETFAVTNTLLHKNNQQPYPDYADDEQVANDFAIFYKDKIDLIRNQIPRSSSTPSPGTRMNIDHPLTAFEQLSLDQAMRLLRSAPSKSCSLDPIPTWILKQSAVAPHAVQNIINWSLSTSTMPPSQKIAIVKPLLKKPSLDNTQLKNFRPVSNLSFLSKLTEKAVAMQLKEHCALNHIDVKFQSAYKKGHSTETALTRVQDDLLRAVDSQGGAILVLLDLSAAFDTLDHPLLIQALDQRIGIRGSALDWFRSYLLDRQQRVCINGHVSQPLPLLHGVPQGSVLGPSLFCLYTQPLADLLDSRGLQHHLYADDSQIYLPIKPRDPPSFRNLQQCVQDVQKWMSENYLKLNSDKTELLVLSTPTLSRYRISSLTLCDSVIESNQTVRNLGVIFDSTLSLRAHISDICKKAYYQLWRIKQIRRNISEECAKTLVQSSVMSLLDYCNSLLVGLPACEINRLQMVQNCAARIIKCASRREHITPLLHSLHWLPIKFRIMYKVNLLTFKALHCDGPSYISELVPLYEPNRELRSSQQNLLLVPRYRLRTFGGRSFSSCAPLLWNNLSPDLRSETSLSCSKSKLKPFYILKAFS